MGLLIVGVFGLAVSYPFLLGRLTSKLVDVLVVGVAGFEPTTSSSRTKRATKLRHTPCAAGDSIVASSGWTEISPKRHRSRDEGVPIRRRRESESAVAVIPAG